IEVIPVTGTLWAAVNGLLNEKKIKKAAFDGKRMTVAERDFLHEKLCVKLIPVNGVCETLRCTKSAQELDWIRMAQHITDDAFTYILTFIKSGMTEREIAAELEYFIRKRGGTLAFDTICVFGKNSSLPHGVPSDTVIEGTGFLTMDFGAAYNGYCSDMTRTVVIGNPTQRMKDVYEVVRVAQQKALDGIKAGMTGAESDSISREYIDSTDYRGLFTHSLGHSLGLEIHEEPRFSPSWKEPIEAGTVMSVEPGIYIPDDFGARIEDIVIVTKDGCEVITASPKEMIILNV
ncbi:MAG TPA: M24 family metallopeptidase, partial [Bacillota bacterium]|nr:M24 family metallopeptidase [Bacillota bacterium]